MDNNRAEYSPNLFGYLVHEIVVAKLNYRIVRVRFHSVLGLRTIIKFFNIYKTKLIQLIIYSILIFIK